MRGHVDRHNSLTAVSLIDSTALIRAATNRAHNPLQLTFFLLLTTFFTYTIRLYPNLHISHIITVSISFDRASASEVGFSWWQKQKQLAVVEVVAAPPAPAAAAFRNRNNGT